MTAAKASGVRRAFFAVFAAVFLFLFLQVVFFNPHYDYKAFAVVPLAAVWTLVFYGLYRLCGRFEAVLCARERWLLLGFFVLLCATQVLFYTQLAVWPTSDFERVYTGAVNFSVNGFIEDPYLDYFYKYPNNLPLTIVLSFFFRAAGRLGIHNFYAVGVVLNALGTQLCYLFVYLSVRKRLGVRQAFFALGLFYLCLPVHCHIGVFYTDMMTIWAAPAGYWAYLYLRRAGGWKQRALWALVMALPLALGTALKYSVILVGIAIGMDLLLRLNWRGLLAGGLAFLLVYGAVSGFFSLYTRSHFLDPELADDRATPFLSWIMMGLEEPGGHNPDDNYMIWSQPNRQAKNDVARQVIGLRLKEHGFPGILGYLNRKALFSWGSGNLDYVRSVADSPRGQTFLVECASRGGRYYAQFDTLVQGYYVALFGIIIAGAIAKVRRKNFAGFVPYLTVFGLLLFLLLWEAGHRYLMHYYGIFIICGTLAADELLAGGRRRRETKASEEEQDAGDPGNITS